MSAYEWINGKKYRIWHDDGLESHPTIDQIYALEQAHLGLAAKLACEAPDDLQPDPLAP